MNPTGMTMISLGKYHHLRRCSTDQGHFVVLAIDHRANLLERLNQHAPQPLTDADFVTFKQTIVRALAPSTSGVLVDPAYGIGAGIASGTVDGHRGLLSPIEITDYALHPSKRAVNLIPSWSVEKIKKIGGDGVKLLLPYHPAAQDVAVKQAIVEEIVAACAQLDLPFFLEPIAYSLDPTRPLSNPELQQVVVEMAQTFSAMGVDILKLQFPLDVKQNNDHQHWLMACRAVDAACTVPWALLSAGVDYATFVDQARIACEAGASGVIVGRAVWAEAVTLQGEARNQFVMGIAQDRIRELAAICAAHATPWIDCVPALDVAIDWYTAY
jgi:tagatose 1,6-diphosphate aldolase